MNKIYWVLGAGLIATLPGCSSAGSESKGSVGDYPSGNYGAADASLSAGGPRGLADASASTPAVLPPEQEQNLDFLAPRAGANYVYVANPGRDTVSVIDSTSLAINEVTTGDTPTYLATVPGQDVALVINIGSHTLGILRGATMPTDPIAVVPKANTISISPDGQHAVVWFDSSQTSLSTTTSLSGSTQDVSVITLSSAGDRQTTMTVGYQPSAVVFSSDGAAAFMVTSDGISSLRFADITKPAIAPITHIDTSTVTLAQRDAGAAGPGPLDGGSPAVDGGASPDLGKDATPTTVPAGTGKANDVSVTPDGHYAIARRDGTSDLLLIDLTLTTNNITTLRLSSPVTDLDISPAGTQAFAVLRDESTLVALDIPEGFTDIAHRTPWPLAGETIGSVTVSAKGKYALLYTTALPSKSLVILGLQPGATIGPQAVELQKPIQAVAIAPDEKTALIVHTKAAGNPMATGIDPSTQLDRSYAYTMVRLDEAFAKFVVTSANPTPFAITPLSEYAFVLLRDDTAGVRIAERIDLNSFYADDFMLGSPPNSIAALQTHRVFVGQVHPEGRISFIDWMSGKVVSVTGFALNGRIQQ